MKWMKKFEINEEMNEGMNVMPISDLSKIQHWHQQMSYIVSSVMNLEQSFIELF